MMLRGVYDWPEFDFSKDAFMSEPPIGSPLSNPDWDSAPNVIAYRMQQVENKLIGIDHKLDGMSANYVTLQMLSLTLEPVKLKLVEVENEAKAEELSRKNAQAQLRLALIIAIISPVLSVIVTIVLGTRGTT